MISLRVLGVRLLALASCVSLGACESEAQRRAEGSGSSGPGVAATVQLTPRALAVAGIQTESTRVATVPETFATTGEIEFDPARVVAINAPVGGRLRAFNRNVGDHVEVGDTVVTIESPEFLAGFVGVTAPRSGVITAIGVAPRQLVTASQELYRIASVDRVWLRVDLYGDRSQAARPGRPVEATVPAIPNQVFRGRIATVAPSIEGATQAAAARVPLDNPGRRLLPGMFASVRVATGDSVRGLLIPRSALIYDGPRRLVMIARDSTFFPSVVQVGPGLGDRVVVLRGVSPGERVVTKGGYELYSAGYALTRGGEEEEGEQDR
jgi:multidrug efflux pump subunit AcrA (membrane-fusion protein)